MLRYLCLFSFFYFPTFEVDAQVVSVLEDFEGWDNQEVVFRSDETEPWGVIQVPPKLVSGHAIHGLGGKFLRLFFEESGFIKLAIPSDQFRLWDVSTDFLRFWVKSSKEKIEGYCVLQSFVSIEERKQGRSVFSGRQYFSIHQKEMWQELVWPLISFGPNSELKWTDTISPMVHTIEIYLKGLPGLEVDIDQIEVIRPSWVAPKSPMPLVWGCWDSLGLTGRYPQVPHQATNGLPESIQESFKIVHIFLSLQEDLPNQEAWVDSLYFLTTRGYTPMITIELPTSVTSYAPFPLQSVLDGRFDEFIQYLGGKLNVLNGPVWIRLFHEFNGDWYPWSLARNQRSPEHYINSYRHVALLLKSRLGAHLKLIWCPNALDVPSAPWNLFWSAFPGKDVVDYIGLDVYNGTKYEDRIPWKSFRFLALDAAAKAGYFWPDKPLVLCEVGARNRFVEEPLDAQTKAEWIKGMSETLIRDMPQLCALIWFNEGHLDCKSSPESHQAFIDLMTQWINTRSK